MPGRECSALQLGGFYTHFGLLPGNLLARLAGPCFLERGSLFPWLAVGSVSLGLALLRPYRAVVLQLQLLPTVAGWGNKRCLS